MKDRDVLKHIMESKGMSNSQVAKRLNISNAAMYERLTGTSKRGMPTHQFTETLCVMDYKLIAVPSNIQVPEGGFEVE